MIEKTTGIVLSLRHHNEDYDIATLFTLHHGRLSFLSPAKKTRSRRSSRPVLQPLEIIDFSFRFKPEAHLQRFNGLSLNTPWKDIYFHPAKRLHVFFLAEFLSRVLMATMPDPRLWDSILLLLQRLDDMKKGIEDFPIIFMIYLMGPLGIQPNLEGYTPGSFFDLREGKFTYDFPIHKDFIAGKGAEFISLIPRLNFFNFKVLKLTSGQRSEIIDSLLQFYSIHFPGISTLKSLEIIKVLL